MTEHYRLVKHIETKLASYVSGLKISNDRDYYDENKEAEYFFCKPLSLLFDACVENANDEKRNFPGIDLWDREKRICFQITSTRTKAKVQHTLDEFLDNNLDDDFDRLIILVVTTEQLPSFSKVTLKRNFDFDPRRDVWTIGTLVSKFDALPYEERDKLQAFSDYLDNELPGGEKEAPHLHLPPVSALGKSCFVGRDSEKAQIQARIDGGEKLIVLSGLGGMGKTELAVRFGQDYPGGAVYFIRFEDSFTHTVAKMAPGIRPELSQEELSRPDEYLCDDVLKILESCGEKDILIIDNVDADEGSLSDLMQDSAYKEIRSMKLRLILTTRFDRDRAVGVRPMPEDNLFQIFEKHGVDLEESRMQDLIEAVNGHTLTIDLMARTLNGKGWRKVTAEMMLDAIRNNTLPSEKYRKITSDYSQSPDQAQIYQHLSVVFDAKHIPEDAKNVLRCATLLPADGMNGEYFHEALSEAEQNAFETLIDHGWLNAENGLVTIHPVIRLVCRAELKPSDETCGDFLNALWDQFDDKKYERVKSTQMAELFAQAADTLEDAEAEWLNCSGRLWLELAQHQKAKELYEKHLPTLEKRLPDDHPNRATTYNNVGMTYGALGDHKKALEYLLKALAIFEKVLPQDHPDLASSCNNVGTAYGNLGNHQKALEYKLKALAIFEKVLPQDHPHLATSYNNVGMTYDALGNHQKALEYQLKALAIFEKVLPQDHPDLAQSYNNVGGTYGEMGDHQKALEYQLKALAIQEKVLPQDHPDLATSYAWMGDICGKQGNHQKALEYQLKALAIQEKVLPPDHPSLATSYNNVSSTYGALGDHKKALEYQLKDLAICEKVLPPEHPSLATSYNNVGATYNDMDNHQKALEYLLKALAICEKVLPQNNPDRATAYNNVGYTYMQLGRFSESLELNRKALAIREKSLPEEHSDIENSRQGVALLEMLIKLSEMGIDPQELLKHLQ